MRFTKKQKNTNTKVSPTLSNRAAIGIDITQHAITMVQLSSRSLNQIQLEKYVITALPKNIINPAFPLWPYRCAADPHG